MLAGIEQAVELVVQIGVAGGGIVVEAFQCLLSIYTCTNTDANEYLLY